MASLPYFHGWKSSEYWKNTINRCKGLKGNDFINAYCGVNTNLKNIPINRIVSGQLFQIDEYKNVESYKNLGADLESNVTIPTLNPVEPDYKKYIQYANKLNKRSFYH